MFPGFITAYFDEYTVYPNWELGEYKAFQELVSNMQMQYTYIAFSFKQVFIRIE
jgi:hypothetical protein